jgi:hypothetical protein
MNDEEYKSLNKEVKKKQRIATEWASKIHDVVEDKLWSDYNELPGLAREAVAACEAWAAANAALAEYEKANA